MSQPRVNRSEVKSILDRIYAMPRSAQLNVFAALRDYLGAEDVPENRLDVRIDKQAESLDVMRRVAEHYELSPDTAPTATQWRSAPADVTAGWSVTRIVNTWGRFRFAQAAYVGEPLSRGSAKASMRRKAVRRHSQYEDELEGVRRWLKTSPASNLSTIYDEFAREQNELIEAGQSENLPLRLSAAVRSNVNLDWDQVIAVANDEADAMELREARRERALQRDTGPLGLVGVAGAAAIVGHTGNLQELVESPDFPAHVVQLGHTRGWLAEDVEAYRDRRPFPRREAGEMRHLIVGTAEMAEMRGYAGPASVVTTLHRAPTMLPPPDGRLGRSVYWLRSTVDEWLPTAPARQHMRPRPDKRRRQSPERGE